MLLLLVIARFQLTAVASAGGSCVGCIQEDSQIYQAVTMYSSETCSGKASQVDIVPMPDCKDTKCIPIYGGLKFATVDCMQDPTKYVQGVFSDRMFISMQTFKDSKCRNVIFASILAENECHLTENAAGSMLPLIQEDGTVDLVLFSDQECETEESRSIGLLGDARCVADKKHSSKLLIKKYD